MTPVKIGTDAEDVFRALRKLHPAFEPGYTGIGRWTTLREWQNIDLLALDAWRSGSVVGYEVKVSRADMRSELLKPQKRAAAVAMCTQFYFAVPAGMLTDEERAWEEPEWEPGDFVRPRCGGVEAFGTPRVDRWRSVPNAPPYGGQCQPSYGRSGRKPVQPYTIKVPIPVVLRANTPSSFDSSRDLEYAGNERVPCPACGGKGYSAKSRAQSLGPTLWVPRDVGLVVVGSAGTATVVKPAPKRAITEPIMPYPFAGGTNSRVTPEASSRLQRQAINQLVRWTSYRPDPRHR